MKCEVLQERNYIGIGAPKKGEIITVPDEQAKQLIAQGFMRKAPAPKPKRAEPEMKSSKPSDDGTDEDDATDET